MKKSLLFLLFTLHFFLLTGQEQYLINISELTLRTSTYGYYVDEVLDARTNKNAIGFVLKGLKEVKVSANLENGLESALLNLFQRSFPKNEGQKKMTIRVNHFEIYEISTMSKTAAIFMVNLSFLEKKQNGYLELYNVGATIDDSALNPTKIHNDNIVQGVNYCCKIFSEHARTGRLWQKTFDIDTSIDSIYSNYPILKVQKPKVGFFKTIEDFRDNLPDTSFQFSFYSEEEVSENQWICKAKWSTGFKIDEDDKLYALCDGVHYYLKNGNEFIRLTPKKGGFSFYSFSNKKTVTAEDLVSSVLVSVIASAVLPGFGAIFFFSKNTSLVENHLDFKCSNFISTIIPPQPPKEEATLILHFEKNKNIPTELLPFFVGDQKIENFQPNKVYKLHVKTAGKTTINFGEKGELLTETINLKLYKTYHYEVYYRKGKFKIWEMETGIDALEKKIKDNSVELIDLN
jgi:hypothetical protein